MCFLIRTDSDALTSLERITYEAFQVYPAVKLSVSSLWSCWFTHICYGLCWTHHNFREQAPGPLHLNSLIEQYCSSLSIHLNPSGSFPILPVPRLHPRPIKSEPLGLALRHPEMFFLKQPDMRLRMRINEF